MRRVPVSLLVGLFLLALPARAGEDPIQKELLALEGTWSQVSMEADGQVQESADHPPGMIIRGTLWVETSAAGDSATHFKINPRRDPKQIDRVMGAQLTLPGIYKLEGDTLTLSTPVPLSGKLSRRRPSVFATTPGDPFAVFVYKRIGRADLQAPPWQSDWTEAFRTAKKEGRLVLIDYSAAWCPPCRLMDETVFILPSMRDDLADFVLLRIDVDESRTLVRNQNVYAYPTFAIYDPGERLRFRTMGARPAAEFRRWIGLIRSVEAKLIQASELFDQQKELDAEFLVGNTYSHVKMLGQARDAYKEAEKYADRHGQPGPAQVAKTLWAFTYAREGNPRRALSVLEKLAASPADRETEALIWLTIGHTQRSANNLARAVEAYRHAQSLVAPESRTYQEAAQSIAAVQQ